MIRRIIAYVFFGLGFVTVTFFRKSSVGDITAFLFWGFGFAMFLFGWYFLRYGPSVKDSKEMKRLHKLIDDLKANGEKIRVYFSECEIKTNNYSEERERYGGPNELTTLAIEREIQAWNAIGGHGDKNVKRVDVHQSVLVFKYENNGQTETFYSGIIPKEIITLRFKLDEKKETTLYVDRKDRSRYYFDLDFLQNRK